MGIGCNHCIVHVIQQVCLIGKLFGGTPLFADIANAVDNPLQQPVVFAQCFLNRLLLKKILACRQLAHNQLCQIAERLQIVFCPLARFIFDYAKRANHLAIVSVQRNSQTSNHIPLADCQIVAEHGIGTCIFHDQRSICANDLSAERV